MYLLPCMTKKELRSFVRKQKQHIPVEECYKWSKSVCSRILEHPQWKAAKTVLLYNPMKDELDISGLVQAAFSQGKQVLLPVVKGNDMFVRIVDEYSTYTKGSYGIWEPLGEDFIFYDRINLILVPGLAFDSKNYRLGHGKGYYDRFMVCCTNAYKLGVCFPFQYFDYIPTEAHDLQLDEVLF